MDDWVFAVLILGGTIAMAVWALTVEKKAVSKMSPEQRVRHRKEQKQAAASSEWTSSEKLSAPTVRRKETYIQKA